MKWFFICGLGLAALAGAAAAIDAAAPPQQAAPVFAGKIRVVDADTLDVGGKRVRLHGIDAPEVDQPCTTAEGRDWAGCGAWVSKVVADQFDGAQAQCREVDRDRYGRSVARCTVKGEDMGAQLVRSGLAFAYLEYSSDYKPMEAEALAARRGLHALQLASPSAHRKAKLAARVQSRAAPAGGCEIKGNISKNGRIYHVPGQAFYARVSIREEAGERWFCTEAEAQAAGFRAAKR
ncbi:MAG: thermonuclease family protein [Sulfitobacter sp.]